MLKIQEYDNKYFIASFPYDKILIEEIKEIPGRKYLEKEKCWLIPKIAIKELEKLYPPISTEFPNEYKYLESLQPKRQKIFSRDFPSICSYKYKTEPYHFQKLVTNMALSISAFGIFLDMGLGKTKIAIDVINNRDISKTLVIGPINIIDEWTEQIAIHSLKNFPIIILYGTKKKRLQMLEEFTDNTIAIVNYAGLSSIIDELLLKIDKKTLLILDESHLIKDTRARRTELSMQLSDRTDYKLLLTGTPVPNHLFDIFSQWYIIDKGEHFGDSFWFFRKKHFYSDLHGYHWFVIDKYQQEIKDIIRSQSITLKKEEVAKDLPPKIYETKYVYLSAKEMKIYTDMKTKLIAEIEEKKITKAKVILTKLIRLMQITDGFVKTTENEIVDIGNSKLKTLQEIIEAIGDRKVIIWSHFIRSIERIKETYPDAITFFQDNSRENIDKFKNTETKILISNPQKGGLGLNLDCADYAIYFDNDFSLEHRKQSEDRIYRINSKHIKVIIDIIGKNTIDEKVFASLKNKEEFAEKLLRVGVKEIL